MVQILTDHFFFESFQRLFLTAKTTGFKSFAVLRKSAHLRGRRIHSSSVQSWCSWETFWNLKWQMAPLQSCGQTSEKEERSTAAICKIKSDWSLWFFTSAFQFCCSSEGQWKDYEQCVICIIRLPVYLNIQDEIGITVSLLISGTLSSGTELKDKNFTWQLIQRFLWSPVQEELSRMCMIISA